MRSLRNPLETTVTRIVYYLPADEQRVYLGARARLWQAAQEGKTTFRLRGREKRVMEKIAKEIEAAMGPNFKA